MPTYSMTLKVYSEASSPADAAAEFLAATEDADISFDIVETANAEDAHQAEILNKAIEAARGEYLEDATGTPEDEAYNQAVSDVVAAIGALLEESK
ncbi:hypothetical protein [Streptomyces anulatus]|uniref:hypothetical protein n=1 Tax=Streptomyces anulatus TaxID=1892 RepID=UPI002ED661AE|nr:hypothetical protein OG882_04625 [Streptomyces anulatus]WUD92889.1 hypothetical protein OG703_34015 [Streptomyces anulatus]